jgi:hypothetical protein
MYLTLANLKGEQKGGSGLNGNTDKHGCSTINILDNIQNFRLIFRPVPIDQLILSAMACEFPPEDDQLPNHKHRQLFVVVLLKLSIQKAPTQPAPNLSWQITL